MFDSSSEENWGDENAVREALLELIEIRLTLRFGGAAKRLMEKIKRVENVESLKFLKEAIAEARDVGEVSNILKVISRE